MKRITLIILATFFMAFIVKAQDEDKPALEISGSVDTYWKYDFSGYKDDDGLSNIGTSFADEQNSISIGMIDLSLAKTVGKASFVGEVAFGPRGQYQSIPNGPDGNSFHIQNLYASYAFSDLFSLTAGYMGTFVGYEVISPTGNFNYSTSYLFTSGPFQNAGIKADFNVSDHFSFMVGMFNDWNVYHDMNGISDFGAQVHFIPVDSWDVYVNLITGNPSGTEIDLTTGYQITDAFYLGLNAADYSAPDDGGGFSGVALYPQVSLSDAFALGLRGEYFKVKDVGDSEGTSVFAVTLSGNVKAGPLTVIPELRLDSGKDEIFMDSGMSPTKSASQFLLAAVYAF